MTVGDSKHSVNITFWGDSGAVTDTIKGGDIITLQNFTLNGFNIDQTKFPMNINYKDMYLPKTELKVLSPDVCPEDLKEAKPTKQKQEF